MTSSIFQPYDYRRIYIWRLIRRSINQIWYALRRIIQVLILFFMGIFFFREIELQNIPGLKMPTSAIKGNGSGYPKLHFFPDFSPLCIFRILFYNIF